MIITYGLAMLFQYVFILYFIKMVLFSTYYFMLLFSLIISNIYDINKYSSIGFLMPVQYFI